MSTFTLRDRQDGLLPFGESLATPWVLSKFSSWNLSSEFASTSISFLVLRWSWAVPREISSVSISLLEMAIGKG